MTIGMNLVCSQNVQVWHRPMRGEPIELGEPGWVYIAAVLAHAAEQSFARGAEGSISLASVFRPGIASYAAAAIAADDPRPSRSR